MISLAELVRARAAEHRAANARLRESLPVLRERALGTALFALRLRLALLRAELDVLLDEESTS